MLVIQEKVARDYLDIYNLSIVRLVHVVFGSWLMCRSTADSCVPVQPVHIDHTADSCGNWQMAHVPLDS